jgi:hypothetical protein
VNSQSLTLLWAGDDGRWRDGQKTGSTD